MQLFSRLETLFVDFSYVSIIDIKLFLLRKQFVGIPFYLLNIVLKFLVKIQGVYFAINADNYKYYVNIRNWDYNLLS